MKKVTVFLGQKNIFVEGKPTGETKTIFQITESKEKGEHEELVRAVGLNEFDFLTAVKTKEEKLRNFSMEKINITVGYRFSHKEKIVVAAEFESKKDETNYLNKLWRVLREMPVTA